MTTTVFQISVTGPDKNDMGRRTFHCKNVYRTREAAEAEGEAFGKRCCGDGIWDLESIDKTVVSELIVHGDEHFESIEARLIASEATRALERRLVVDYINAMGPHMEEAWKERFVEVFGFTIDEGNPYRPVRVAR